jgi:hypothetical protein
MAALPFNHVYLYIYLGIGLACSCYFVIKAFIEYLNLSSYRKNFQKPQSFKNQLLELLQHILVYSIASLLCTVTWPVILIWSGIEKIQERQARARELEPKFYSQKEYLIKKVTLEEAERDSYINDPLGMAPKVAFGHLNQAWCNFLAELEEGDEVWLFEIPKSKKPARSSYRIEGGLRGFTRIRDQKIVAEFICQSD